MRIQDIFEIWTEISACNMNELFCILPKMKADIQQKRKIKEKSAARCNGKYNVSLPILSVIYFKHPQEEASDDALRSTAKKYISSQKIVQKAL